MIIITTIIIVLLLVYIIYMFYKSKPTNTIPFVLTYAGVPVVTINIGSQKYQFMVDSGSSHSSVLKSLALSINKPIQDLKGTGVSFNGITDDLQYTAFDFHYNSCYYIEGFMLIPEDQEEGLIRTNKITGFNIVGILGSDFLKKYGWVLDYRKMIAYHKSKVRPL